MPKDIPPRDTALIESAILEYSLTEHQSEKMRELLGYVVGRGIAILSGPAGTGKTRVGAALRRYFSLSSQEEVIVAASTHAAVDVLRKAGGVAPITTSAFFRSPPSELGDRIETRNEERKTDRVAKLRAAAKALSNNVEGCGVVINDESSMTGARQCLAFFELAKNRGWTVILIGDDQQLAPVRDASVGEPEDFIFTDLSLGADYKVKNFALEEVVRQSEGNPIIQLSQKIINSVHASLRSPFPYPTRNNLVLEDGVELGIKVFHGSEVDFVKRAVEAMTRGSGGKVHPEECLLMAFANVDVDRMNLIAIEHLHGDAGLSRPLEYCGSAVAQKSLTTFKSVEGKRQWTVVVPNGAFITILKASEATPRQILDLDEWKMRGESLNTELDRIGEKITRKGLTIYNATITCDVGDPDPESDEALPIDCLICLSTEYSALVKIIKPLGDEAGQRFSDYLKSIAARPKDESVAPEKDGSPEWSLMAAWALYRTDPNNGCFDRYTAEDFEQFLKKSLPLPNDKTEGELSTVALIKKRENCIELEAGRRRAWRLVNTILNQLLSVKAPYARTIHKAQGLTTRIACTTGRSIIAGDFDKKKRLFYTALTRASERFVLFDPRHRGQDK